MTELEGKRIRLRKWRESDVYDLYEYARLENVGPNAGWMPHKNIEESQKIIKSFIDCLEVYAIELKSEKKVIGSIGFHNRILSQEYKDLKQREISVVLNPKYWGNEYSKEAINLLVNHGFDELNLDLIWICHHSDNEKSKRMIQKCNFNYIFNKNVVLERLNNKEVQMQYYVIKKINTI